jgi:aminoglycoside phosphotransferase family enzyme
MVYAHEELMQELGLNQTELPNHIAVQVRAFAQKKRLSTKAEALEKLEQVSEDLADEIATWHVAYATDEDDEDDEEEEEEEEGEEDEEEEEIKPDPIIVKPENKIVTHVSNNEIEEDEDEDEEQEERWGSKRGSW